MNKPLKVTGHTRAGKDGKCLDCPHCGDTLRVYHFDWFALQCQGCKAPVEKQNWLIAAAQPLNSKK